MNAVMSHIVHIPKNMLVDMESACNGKSDERVTFITTEEGEIVMYRG